VNEFWTHFDNVVLLENKIKLLNHIYLNLFIIKDQLQHRT